MCRIGQEELRENLAGEVGVKFREWELVTGQCWYILVEGKKSGMEHDWCMFQTLVFERRVIEEATRLKVRGKVGLLMNLPYSCYKIRVRRFGWGLCVGTWEKSVEWGQLDWELRVKFVLMIEFFYICCEIRVMGLGWGLCQLGRKWKITNALKCEWRRVYLLAGRSARWLAVGKCGGACPAKPRLLLYFCTSHSSGHKKPFAGRLRALR